MRAILIVGLPGSGKTYLAKNEFIPAGFHLVDDPKSMEEIAKEITITRAHCHNGIVIADPNLTLPGNIKKAKDKLNDLGCSLVSVIYFENDVKKAAANVLTRNLTEEDRGNINVEFYSERYQIPDGVSARPIFQATTANKL